MKTVVLFCFIVFVEPFVAGDGISPVGSFSKKSNTILHKSLKLLNRRYEKSTSGDSKQKKHLVEYTVFPPHNQNKPLDVPSSPFFPQDVQDEPKLRVKKVLPDFWSLRRKRSPEEEPGDVKKEEAKPESDADVKPEDKVKDKVGEKVAEKVENKVKGKVEDKKASEKPEAAIEKAIEPKIAQREGKPEKNKEIDKKEDVASTAVKKSTEGKATVQPVAKKASPIVLRAAKNSTLSKKGSRSVKHGKKNSKHASRNKVSKSAKGTKRKSKRNSKSKKSTKTSSGTKRKASKKNSKRETRRKDEPSRRLIAGRDALIENYPYAVSIQKDGEHWCAGALLNQRVVITTANCVWKASHVSRLRIRACSRSVDYGGQTVKISEVMKHPRWSIRSSPDNDVALLLTDANVRFSHSCHAVDLPNRIMMPIFDDAWVVSWGTQRRDGIYDKQGLTLQVYHARLMERNKCNNVTMRFGVQVTENFICLEQNGRRAPCTRDTGAPAVSDGVLWGMASWGIRKLCGTERFPAMFSYTASQTNMDFIINATAVLMAEERLSPFLDRYRVPYPRNTSL